MCFGYLCTTIYKGGSFPFQESGRMSKVKRSFSQMPCLVFMILRIILLILGVAERTVRFDYCCTQKVVEGGKASCSYYARQVILLQSSSWFGKVNTEVMLCMLISKTTSQWLVQKTSETGYQWSPSFGHY